MLNDSFARVVEWGSKKKWKTGKTGEHGSTSHWHSIVNALIMGYISELVGPTGETDSCIQ